MEVMFRILILAKLKIITLLPIHNFENSLIIFKINQVIQTHFFKTNKNIFQNDLDRI